MRNSSKFILRGLAAIILLYQAPWALSEDECSSRSPLWKDLGGDFCYIVDVYSRVPWIEAVNICFSEGGSLASFHSLEEIRRIVDYVNDDEMRLYTGLYKNNYGSLQWVDMTPVDFLNWYPGEPNIFNEKCVEIYIASGQWNDIDCNRKFGYICSVRKDSPRIQRRRSCPVTSTEWENFGGEVCYIIESEDKATWEEASHRCVASGGTLASFHSIEEISSVLHHTKQYNETFYIGLRMNEGTYEWADGSPVDLDYWDSVVDMDLYNEVGAVIAERRDCTQMALTSGRWIDVSCERMSSYICSSSNGVCGGNIVSESGIISSPNYPMKYGRNANCIWQITVPSDYQVVLEFLAFETEGGHDCRYDFVEIRDGSKFDSQVLGKFCGQNVPEPIRSSTNEMTIRFVSDILDERQGFAATFRKEASS